MSLRIEKCSFYNANSCLSTLTGNICIFSILQQSSKEFMKRLDIWLAVWKKKRGLFALHHNKSQMIYFCSEKKGKKKNERAHFQLMGLYISEQWYNQWRESQADLLQTGWRWLMCINTNLLSCWKGKTEELPDKNYIIPFYQPLPE